jgi:hypothetical protein
MSEAKLRSTRKLSSSAIFWLFIVAGVALAERILVILFYQPVSYSDTASYRRLANSVLQRFANYDGTRTPGYPVFLALTGTDQRAWLVQLALGLLTTLLLFYLGWKLTGKAWFGGLAGLAHTLNLGQLFFESNLITESVTTFFLVLTMAGVLFWLRHPELRRPWLAVVIGLLSSITLLIRPLFIYLPFFLFLYFWLEGRLSWRPINKQDEANARPVRTRGHYFTWWAGTALFLPVVVLLGGWIGFIHQQFNQWSITTMTGYHLVQHTGAFFEYVPDEYASLRDTYIKYRDAHIAEFGTQTNAIWDAIPEMSKVSGYSFYGLSRVLTKISLQLIWQHPGLFLKSAAWGWWMFWRAPVYWSADSLQLPALSGVISGAILVQRAGLILANFLFILGSIYFSVIEGYALLRRKSAPLSKRFHSPILYSFLCMLLANIWVASILQTLLDHGDNPRFLIPLQSLVVLWVGLFIYQLVITRKPDDPRRNRTQLSTNPTNPSK